MAGDLIMMVAPNGGRRSKADHPAIPLTIAEMVEDVASCRDAGTAMAHIHVRTRDGDHTLDPGLYREAIAAIDDKVGDDLVVQVTTEAIGQYASDEQMAVVRDLKPKAVSIALQEILPEDGDAAEFGEFLHWMKDADVWPQFILYGPDDLVRFQELMGRGLVPFAEPSVLFVLGRYSQGQEADPSDLQPFLDAREAENLIWCFCAFGTRVFECAERVMSEGGHVRIGLENNYWLPDGERTGSNADLMRATADTAAKVGRTPMTAAEIRALRARSMA